MINAEFDSSFSLHCSSNFARIPGADVALNGGASWRRLLAEVEVAVRLAHPPEVPSEGVTCGTSKSQAAKPLEILEESVKNFAAAAICAGGEGMLPRAEGFFSKEWKSESESTMLLVFFTHPAVFFNCPCRTRHWSAWTSALGRCWLSPCWKQMSHAQCCRFPSTTSPKWRVLKDVETFNTSISQSNTSPNYRTVSVLYCPTPGVLLAFCKDVASKLMLPIAFEPLSQRLRYVTARVGREFGETWRVADWKSLGLWDRHEKCSLSW